MSLCPKCETRLKEEEPRCAHCGFSVEGQEQNRSTTFFEAPTEFPQPEERNQATQPSDPLIGRVLDSKYKLVARLGAGGMGIVYRAQRLHIGDEIVVKVLSSNLINDEQALERFRREARAAAMLHHPNIVTIHDFGDARGMDAPAYIVMEMVRGSSLREVLKKERRLDMERAVRLMRQVCAGVGAAHLNGVVHRDLKPDNIIVLPPGLNDYYETVKVVDFGIAKLRDALVTSVLTPYGHTMGTPHYMSPEQWRGKEVDARSDVYSLGCVFYEMLAGSTPFRSESFEGMLTSHLFEDPPPLPPELDARPVEAVYLRSLSKQPDLRQQDATLLARELKEALQFQQKEAEKQLRAQEAARTVETRTKEEQQHAGRSQIDESAHARAAEKIRLIEEERRQEEQRRRKISEAGRAAEPRRRNDEHDAASPPSVAHPPAPAETNRGYNLRSSFFQMPLLIRIPVIMVATMGAVVLAFFLFGGVLRIYNYLTDSSGRPSYTDRSDSSSNPNESRQSSTAAATPAPLSRQVTLKLRLVSPGAERYFSADNIPVSLSYPGGKIVTLYTDTNGYVTFTGVPCDQDIDVSVYSSDKQWIIKTNLDCNRSFIDMGGYSISTGMSVPDSELP